MCRCNSANRVVEDRSRRLKGSSWRRGRAERALRARPASIRSEPVLVGTAGQRPPVEPAEPSRSRAPHM